MHLMATYLPVLMLYAFNTSENVPSPFLLISLYSKTNKVILNIEQYFSYASSSEDESFIV